MKRIGFSLLAVLFLLSGITSVASAQTPPEELDPTTLFAGLTFPFFTILLIVLIAGAVGGVVYELLILQGNIEKPHKPDEKEFTETFPHAVAANMYDLGILARVIIGALSAVAALLVLTPDTLFSLLATSLIAGSAGTAIFRSLQDRLIASLAVKDAATVRENATLQNEKVQEALAKLQPAKAHLEGTAVGAALPNGLPVEAAPMAMAASVGDLGEVERLLIEAEGIHQAMLKPKNP